MPIGTKVKVLRYCKNIVLEVIYIVFIFISNVICMWFVCDDCRYKFR
jgi:hypothetical protein